MGPLIQITAAMHPCMQDVILDSRPETPKYKYDNLNKGLTATELTSQLSKLVLYPCHHMLDICQMLYTTYTDIHGAFWYYH